MSATVRHITSIDTVATPHQAGNVVRLPARSECQVTAALTRIAAGVRSGDIVGVSVVMTTAEGVVTSEKLC